MMSAAQSQTTMEAKLKDLHCHFTWDLEPSRSKLFRLRDTLEDIGTEEGKSWLGHIYNLQGYIHYKLGLTEDALRFFGKATEGFRQIRNTDSDEGPWLVVNYGNLACLHHHLKQQAESQTYLLKVYTLMKEYPPPSQDELHPEIYAEKAWTLMNFDEEKKLQAADFFKKAISMQPKVEWQTSRVIALVNAYRHNKKPLEQEILEEMKIAKERDPENLYLAALYLEECEKKEKIKDEVLKLAVNVLDKPVSSYSGMTPLLRVFREYVSKDEAIKWAEKAVEKHPDERHLKWCSAMCYKERIFSHKDNPPEQSIIEGAIKCYKEVISLYPHSSLKVEIYLADTYAKSNHSQNKADQIYKELLKKEKELEDADRQMVYNRYAKHLNFIRHDTNMSIKYHMKAAEIRVQSRSRENSIRTLRKILERNRHPMCAEIRRFLDNLQY